MEPAPGRPGQQLDEEHADLAVLDPSGGSGVLPLDSGRTAALLQKFGLVDDQHAVIGAEVLDDVGTDIIADLIGTPVHGS